MRPLSLIIDGIAQKGSQVYDFTTRTANLTAIITKDINTLKKLISTSFYGGEKEGKLKFSYEYNGENYIVERDFDEKKASLSYEDGTIISEDEKNVNNKILSQIKMDKSAFDILVAIDRDAIYDGFLAKNKERYLFVQNMLDDCLKNSENVVDLEKKIKSKYDNLQIKLELLEEVDPQELTDLKEKIDKNIIEKEDIKKDLKILADAIRIGEDTQKAKIEFDKDSVELEKAQKQKLITDEMQSQLQKSKVAENVISLIKCKQEILLKDVAIKEKAKELQEKCKEDEKNINNGEKTVAELQEVIVHCLERNKELRKILYDKIHNFKEGSDFEKEVQEGVDNYFEGEDKELILISKRKKEIDEEYEAVSVVCQEIEKRISEIKFNSSLSQAIREGAMLETEIKKLKETLALSNLNIEVYNKKLSEITKQIISINENINNDKLNLLYASKNATGEFGSKEEAANVDAIKKQSLYRNHILVVNQEESIEAVNKKINENIQGLNSYYEDLEALDSAKQGLIAYLDKIKKKEVLLQNEIIDVKTKLKYSNQIKNIEYGKKCPICSNIVLYKDSKDREIADNNKRYEKLNNELEKVKNILEDYNEKFTKINTRIGELTARIKISEAYIKSLRETIVKKKETILAALKEAEVENTYELAEKLKEAIAASNALQSANREYFEISTRIKLEEEKKILLVAEKQKIEDIELPREMEIFNSSTARLQECQTKYKPLKELLGDTNAVDRLNEITLKEKERETLEETLSNKKVKRQELFGEKEKIDRLIPLLSNRRRNIEIEGKELTYQQVIARTVSEQVNELVQEIEKSEKEADEIKIELIAVKRVLSDVKAEYQKRYIELQKLNDIITTDEDVLNKMMFDYEKKIEMLEIKNVKELENLIFAEDKKLKINKEISENNDKMAIYSSKTALNKKILLENEEYLNKLEENRKTYFELEELYEEKVNQIASIMAQRGELKKKAKQRLALKEKATRYKNKISFLGDMSHILSENGDLASYIIKVASKRLYALTKGKYNLDIIGDEMKLINNRDAGKTLVKEDFSGEEKTLVSLVLGTSLHRTIIDMIGGENFMLMFPLYKKETNKKVADALATYAKKTTLMVVAEDKDFKKELEKIV